MFYILDVYFFFFFNDTATTEIYTLSLHDALPISRHASKPSVSGALLDVLSAASADRFTELADSKARAKQDRKSTRLNSSHSQISYAVFCLKKKQKNKQYKI